MDERMRIIIALMEDGLRRERSLNDLARSVSLSRSRFQHLFRAETGTPPAHYLRALRLDYARELLETSLLSVKQVMASVGISDKSHFGREFKKAYGLPPTEYRSAHLLMSGVKNDREWRVAKTATR